MSCRCGKKHSHCSILYSVLLNYSPTSNPPPFPQPPPPQPQQQLSLPYISLFFKDTSGGTLSIPVAQLTGNIVNENTNLNLASQPSYSATGNPTLSNFVLSITGTVNSSLQMYFSFDMILFSQPLNMSVTIPLLGTINNPGANNFNGSISMTIKNISDNTTTITKVTYNITLYL
jgi:hypothetical protein